MKNLLLIFFLIVHFLSFSQKYQIEFPVTNYIFSQIENPFNFNYCGDLNDIELSSKNAKIIKYDSRKYSIRTNKTDNVEIYVLNKKSKLTDTINIRVKKSPKPKVELYGFTNEIDIKKNLVHSNGLTTTNVELPSWNVDDNSLTFDLTIIIDNETYKFKKQKNPFNDKIKELFSQLNKGDLVVFYNVRFNVEPFENMNLSGLTYEIE